MTLGETTSKAYTAAKIGDQVARAEWLELFGGPRVAGIAGQLRDLKSRFAPYVIDPVATTLLDWGFWSAIRSPRRSLRVTVLINATGI